MIFSILACVGALLLLLQVLRRDRLSLGLPLAYLASLLLIHVPGALAHLVGGSMLYGGEFVEMGMKYAAIGAACFVAGVWAARTVIRPAHAVAAADRPRFAVFCLVGGWIFVYGLTPISRTPSLGAAVAEAGGVWVLGALLGLRAAVRSGAPQRILVWTAALSVYPVLMLLMGGFLSYGSAAAIVVVSVLAISARRYWRALGGIALATIVGLTIFVNYFEHRDDIRANVWGRASMEDRIDSVADMIGNFHLIDLGSEHDLVALDQRLNQNFFVGVAAARIRDGEVGYLNGQSVWEGVLALVPRAFWPDKPVFAGSGNIVARMTGLQLSESTSWGVGNVMEFYINFGLAGLVVGFLALGCTLGALDILAAAAERRGDFKSLLVFFLPAVALIQPGGSIVEMTGGAAAALVAAFGWRWVWSLRAGRPQTRVSRSPSRRLPQSGVGPVA